MFRIRSSDALGGCATGAITGDLIAVVAVARKLVGFLRAAMQDLTPAHPETI